jgi:hypothetical protein
VHGMAVALVVWLFCAICFPAAWYTFLFPMIPLYPGGRAVFVFAMLVLACSFGYSWSQHVRTCNISIFSPLQRSLYRCS